MKIPFNETETLNYLIQEESMEISWGNRFIGIKSQIFSTKDLAKKYKKPITEKIKVFEPYKLNFIFIGIVGFIFIIAMINAMVNQIKSGDIANVVIPFFLLFILAGVLGTFFDKKRNFKISVSKDQLIIKDINYQWEEIYKAYIISRPKGKAQFYFLILALDTGVTDRHDITNLMGLGSTENKLSAYIEHFKNLN